jgi:hypothetical protein
MPTITIDMPEISGEAGPFSLWLRKRSDRALVNTGGDTLTEIEVATVKTGVWSATIDETIPAEDCYARVYQGTTETPANIIGGGILFNGQTEVGKEAAASSGGLTTEQAAQLNRLEAQTSKLSGSPVTVNGNVKPGGQIVLKHGDNHTVALLNSISVPVDDVGGSLYALMQAVGVGNISVAAIRGADPASRIVGTTAALSYASNILTVTFEFTSTETAKGIVGPVYTYDVYRSDNPSRTFFSGKLTVTRDARP